MEIVANVTVRGAKLFRGNLDGKDIDSAKIFTDVELKGETAWGTCTQELKCKDSKVVDAIKHNPFPFIAQVSMIQESNGKVSSLLVTSIKPMQALKEQGGQKAA